MQTLPAAPLACVAVAAAAKSSTAERSMRA